MTPSAPTLAPFASRATTIVAGWTDVTERFWDGMGRPVCVAFERRYGPVVMLVFRDYSGWACRCGMFSRRLRALTVGEATGEAVAMLRAAARELAEVL